MHDFGGNLLTESKTDRASVNSFILLIQRNLECLSQALIDAPSQEQPSSKATCIEFFTRRLEEISIRGKLFGDLRLFEDPAWNILVDLYVSEARARPVSITSACIAAKVPASTALRWIAALENAGLVQRLDDRADARRRLLTITDKGKGLLFEYYERCTAG